MGSLHLGVYLNKWLVYFMENPTNQWMMTGGTGGTPIAGWFIMT